MFRNRTLQERWAVKKPHRRRRRRAQVGRTASLGEGQFVATGSYNDTVAMTVNH
jgi:hypothetical protein